MQESGVFHRAEVNESGYLGKIDLFTAGVALAEFPKPLVAVLGQCRVGRQHFGGRFPGDGQDLAVERRVGDLQVRGHAALERTVHVARTPQLEVQLRQAESVVGFAHRFEPQAGLASGFSPDMRIQ